MADELREFFEEHFNRLDAKLDRAISMLMQLQTSQAGALQRLAVMDNRDLRAEQRLERMEARLDTIDPAVPR